MTYGKIQINRELNIKLKKIIISCILTLTLIFSDISYLFEFDVAISIEFLSVLFLGSHVYSLNIFKIYN